MDQEPSLMVMCYTQEMGWTAEKLGPMSTHRKRLAKEVKPKIIEVAMGLIG